MSKYSISVYCGTWGKYAAGSIEGAWLDLSDYSSMDAFLEACAELHKDEEDPEYMFQDVDNETLFPTDGEPGLDEIEAMIDFLQLDDDDREILGGYLDAMGRTRCSDVWADLREARDAYAGTWEDFAEFAEQTFRDCHSIPDELENYIDWDAVERSYSWDYSQAANNCIYFNH